MRFILAAILGLMIAGAPALAAVPVGELPSGVKPLGYRIDLTIDPSKERFEGRTQIDFELKAPTRTIYLHGRDLRVNRAEVWTGRMAPRPVSYKEVDVSGVAEVTLPAELPAGRHTVHFVYDAPFSTATEGLYRVQVKDGWYAWTQFQAIDARRVFPGFDEPAHKVSYTVSIAAPAGQKAFANTPETGTKAEGALVRHQFAPTKPLPTYLLAFAVGDFDVVEGSIPPNAVRKEPLAFRAIATKGQAPRLATTMSETPKILAILEDYFGIPYPYEKLDVIASPIMGGAMENAGLVTFDDTLLLLDKDAPPSQLRFYGEVMAHELAHMWFGDYVTPRWWDDIWLNESFADWLGNRVGAQWRPDLGGGIAQLDSALDAMDGDSRAANRPIRQQITRSQDIGAAFDGITYQKGGQVIRMFERYLGEERFKAGVRLHIARHPHGTATADQFFQAIADGAKDPRVVEAWRSFVDREGVPMVSFADAGGGAYSLNQQRYKPIGVDLPTDRTWLAPGCARSGEGVQCTLLDKATGGGLKVTGTAPWLSGNADGAGYYRYDLPKADWDRLIAAAAGLPAMDALAAADSLWAGYLAGRGDAGQLMNAAGGFAQHRERLVAVRIPYEIAALDGRVLSPSDSANLERAMRTWFGPKLGELGLNPARGAYASEDSERRQLRQTLASFVALNGNEPQARATLVKAADAALGGDAAALDPAYRPAALTAAARDLGKPFRDKLFAALLASDDPLFRRQAVQALGSVDTAEAGRETVARVTTKGLNSRESLGMLLLLSNQPATRPLVLDWIEANYPEFRSRTGGLLGGAIGFTGNYCTEVDAKRVDELFRPKLAEANVSTLDLERPLAQIRQCVALREAKGAELSAALAAVR